MEAEGHLSLPTQGSAALPADAASIAAFRHDRLSPLLLRFLNRLKQTGRSVHTIAAYRNDLNLFSEFLVEKQFDPQLYSLNLQSEWLHFLGAHGRKSAASVRRALMSVRTFLHFLVLEKVIVGSPFLEVKSPRQPCHDLLTILPAHYKILCKTLRAQALEGDEKAIRDWCLVLVLGGCGLKATEAACLTWGDLMLEGSISGSIEGLAEGSSKGSAEAGSAAGTLRVTGPNERMLKFGLDLHQALCLLRQVRTRLELGTSAAHRLFFGYMNVSRKTRTDSLHRHGIKFVVYEACEEILKVPYNSESLRNYAIVRWLEQGLSSQQVADLAGYSSLNSLERFSLQTRGIRKPKRQSKSHVGEA